MALHCNTHREAVSLALIHVLWDEDEVNRTPKGVNFRYWVAVRAYERLYRQSPMHRAWPR